MKSYRLHFLDTEGAITRAIEERFPDDDAATAWAGRQRHEHGKELWDQDRLVLCFTSSGEAWRPRR